MAVRISPLAGALAGAAEGGENYLDTFMKQQHEKKLRDLDFTNRMFETLALHPETAPMIQSILGESRMTATATNEAAARKREAAAKEYRTEVTNPVERAKQEPRMGEEETIGPGGETIKRPKAYTLGGLAAGQAGPTSTGMTTAQRATQAGATAAAESAARLPSQKELTTAGGEEARKTAAAANALPATAYQKGELGLRAQELKQKQVQIDAAMRSLSPDLVPIVNKLWGDWQANHTSVLPRVLGGGPPDTEAGIAALNDIIGRVRASAGERGMPTPPGATPAAKPTGAGPAVGTERTINGVPAVWDGHGWKRK